MHTRCTRLLSAISVYLILAASTRASEVVQVYVSVQLTGRAVTTFTDGKLVPRTKGIDGKGLADGYLTAAEAVASGDKNAKALPEDGGSKATATHPFVRLNFSNADGPPDAQRGRGRRVHLSVGPQALPTHAGFYDARRRCVAAPFHPDVCGWNSRTARG